MLILITENEANVLIFNSRARWDILQNINACCAVSGVSCTRACRLRLGCRQDVMRRRWAAPHHFPESLAKVFGQKCVQEWIQTRV